MVIWSKDRPMQLDALLTSTEMFFKNIDNIYILYNCSNDQFKQGYSKLMHKRFILNIAWFKEISFNKDIKRILKSINTEYVFGNSDDNIFIRDVDFGHLPFDYGDDIAAFSLRLGRGLSHCQPAHLDMAEPDYIFSGNKKYIKWDWVKGDKRVCYYYPHPVDSNIYKTEYLHNLIKDAEFDNPYHMELYMDNHRLDDKPYMLAFDKPRLLSIANNEIGQGGQNTAGTQSVEKLNEMYLDGWVIDPSNLYGIETNACHRIIPYKFMRG